MNNPIRITKKELRNILQITPTALANMLNVHYIDVLEPLGYKKTQKYLLRHQLDKIFPAGIQFEKNEQ